VADLVRWLVETGVPMVLSAARTAASRGLCLGRARACSRRVVQGSEESMRDLVITHDHPLYDEDFADQFRLRYQNFTVAAHSSESQANALVYEKGRRIVRWPTPKEAVVEVAQYATACAWPAATRTRKWSACAVYLRGLGHHSLVACRCVRGMGCVTARPPVEYTLGRKARGVHNYSPVTCPLCAC
jgi:hypothetical protein